MHDSLKLFRPYSITAAGLIFASFVFLNSALLSRSAPTESHLAPCHRGSSMPLPSGHHHLPNHDCCFVGHHRALPAQFWHLSEVPVVAIAHLISQCTSIDFEEGRLLMVDDSSPPDGVGLRI